MSCLRSICSNFVRAKRMCVCTRLWVLSTLMTVIFNILFLVVFDMGITGYVLATVLADFLSSVFLFLVANLKQYIDFKGFNRSVSKQMLRYAIPMIPTTIFWWITNVSDRFLVTYMISEAANGLYAVSYKIPTLINLVSGIFIEAWQMSAVTETKNPTARCFLPG